MLNRAHCACQTAPLAAGQPAEDIADFLVRSNVERSECLTAFRRELQMTQPGVGAGRSSAYEAALFEGLEDSAEIPRVEAQSLADIRCRRPVAVRQLIQHADFGKGKWTSEQPLVQNPDLPRVEAIELSNGLDLRGERRHGQGGEWI